VNQKRRRVPSDSVDNSGGATTNSNHVIATTATDIDDVGRSYEFIVGEYKKLFRGAKADNTFIKKCARTLISIMNNIKKGKV
jgi:hypothetical protein